MYLCYVWLHCGYSVIRMRACDGEEDVGHPLSLSMDGKQLVDRNSISYAAQHASTAST